MPSGGQRLPQVRLEIGHAQQNAQNLRQLKIETKSGLLPQHYENTTSRDCGKEENEDNDDEEANLYFAIHGRSSGGPDKRAASDPDSDPTPWTTFDACP